MSTVVYFPGSTPSAVTQVGGKGLGLICLADAGFRVPPGAILTTEYFAPWAEQIGASPTWAALVSATEDEAPAICAAVQELCASLAFTTAQRGALQELRDSLATSLGWDLLLAVRSSSPQEDQAGASFAGTYETRLGVSPAELEDAVRHCFASSYSERVLAYRRARGLGLGPPMAVIVQQQVTSEVAGVAFSLNPVTNDYDEAVIDANWGLGESVVAGRASPDHYVVDRVSGRILERTLGAKQVSVWVEPRGGTVERADHAATEWTLSDAQVGELTGVLGRIEAAFATPVDVEWAYADGRLYLLQARPITTYVPLPPEMVTPPSERRLLYADIALAGGLTINTPISPLGLSWMQEGVGALTELLLGPLRLELRFAERLWFFAGHRMYQNLSNVLWLAKPAKLAKGNATSDALMAEILRAIDADRYRSATRPPWARLRMLRLVPRVLWRLRRFFRNAAWALLAPERAHKAYTRAVRTYEEELARTEHDHLSLSAYRQRFTTRAIRHILDVTMAPLAAGLLALAVAERVVGKASDVQEFLPKLRRGFTGNVVTDMGIALFRMATLLDRAELADIAQLADRVAQRQLPREFLQAWDAFLATYGWRGPNEMDLKSPRYADDPYIALRQLSLMTTDDERFDPGSGHDRLIEERRAAYQALMGRLGWLRRRILRWAHHVADRFAGTRDTPKHHNLLFYYGARKRVLATGQRYVETGRLDAADHIFDLTLADLADADADPSLDLRRLRAERTRFLQRLRTHVRQFPPVIDSRGRILRPPPRPSVPGELHGMAVSPGVASGPAKVLHHPEEKPVAKGDVLVAYTTDPGWTPLFVNAAAVVLEVGGVLQHGAVVAREYGKPCVVGIEGVTTKLQDGGWIEVDGTAGVIRVVSRS